MATPSASQYHGTIVVAIIAGVAAMAIWASLSMRGVGPYRAEVVSITDAPPGAALVTLLVENQGTSRGAATCRLEARDANGAHLRTGSLVTGQLDGGSSGTFTGRLGGLSELPASVVPSCR